MKKMIFFAALLLGIAFTANAQQIHNNTHCPIQVKQVCLNAACAVVSSTLYSVPGPGSAVITPCPGGTLTLYTVCYVPNQCGLTPNCTTIDGNVPMSACGPGTYTGNILSCDFCYNTGAGANVSFDPATGDVNINP